MRARDIEETQPLLIPDLVAIGALVLWGLWWLAPGLNHPSIHNWDESFHQAVVRGTAKHFWPTMYEEPFLPLQLRSWWYSTIWLHKAPGVFWWGAMVLKVVGVTTAALRSASLVGELAMAVLIYLLARPLAGRFIALTAGAAFLLLPFGWILVQGHFVADVTDVAVSAFVTLAFAWLWWAVERDSVRWAFFAGAAVGVGYLCKTFLALDPLGVALAWWLLGLLRFSKGPSLKQLLVMLLGFVIVAAPWNVFAYLKWPDVYMRAFDHTTGFIEATSGEDVGSGARPTDAIFNEINWTVARLIPHPFSLLAGVWLVIRALKDRDGRVAALALWLWSTWLVHSYSHVKGHGHLWNAVPAMVLAYAVLVHDAFKHRALAAAALASFAVWHFRPAFGLATALRDALPGKWVQTKTWADSNLSEQVLLVPPAALLAWLLGVKVPERVRRRATAVLAAAAAAVLGWYALVLNPRELKAQRERMARERQWSSSEDLGLALMDVLEPKAVFFMDTNNDYGTSFDYLGLMFWSGRMVYRMPPDVALAQSKGYRPYLVSPAAEAFAPLPQVPAYASLRAYDLLAPAEPAPLPPGLQRLDVPLQNVVALGWAARALDDRFSRYAFYVAPRGAPSDVRVTYRLDDGTAVQQTLQVQATLRGADRLAQAAWFVLPDVGPLHTRVKAIELAQ